jgi:hypothetical protein
MPNAWIPLELEIAELTAAGKQILPLKEIDALNNDSEVSTLSAEDLKRFLKSDDFLQNFYLWIVFIHCINKHTMLQNQVISTFVVFEKLVYLVVKRCSSFLNILLKINYFCFR